MSDRNLDSELESFRQQWLSEVRSRQGESSSFRDRRPSDATVHASLSLSAGPPSARSNAPPSPTALRKPIIDDGTDYIGGYSFDEPAPTSGHTLDGPPASPSSEKKKKLVTALDHYEAAMQKEAQGNMGDSLTLYRQAYRLDHRVEKRYREKHFPNSVPSVHPQPTTELTKDVKPSAPAESTDVEPKPLSVKELLASFSALKIEATPPDVEGAPPLPCPIAKLPDEILIHIMHDVALTDVADYVRLSLVCKHLAYLVATEQRIWRRICIGTEFGFAGMQYRWATPIEWGRGIYPDYFDEELEHVDEDGNVISPREIAERRRIEAHLTTLTLTPSVYPTWKNMFRHRPRIRFNGCYISTVNYIRTGQASTNQSTWGGSPIHIVTYYRYLRFFRDGSLVSLLTTMEPNDVVHHLSRENLLLHQDAAQTHLPSSVMHLAHRGRWRLSPPGTGPNQSITRQGAEKGIASGDSDVYVETEGVGTKYLYRMDLSMRSAGKTTATRNNKLIWRSFHSYNKLTDDWGEFGLKNDKPFFFSRVRSYGLR